MDPLSDIEKANASARSGKFLISSFDLPEENEPSLLDRFFSSITGVVRFYVEIFSLFASVVAALIQLRGNQWKHAKTTMMHQIIFSGIDAFLVVGAIAAMVGGVVMVQLVAYSSAFATEELMMDILVAVIIRELAPLITTLILIARSGSAITIELGMMKLKKHHIALDSIGINIIKYFHVPRVLGLTITNIILNAYFLIITLAAALFISLFRENINIEILFFNFVNSLKISDLALSFLKGGALGITIALICIRHAWMVRKSPTEIPQQTSQALVNAYMVCYMFNMIFSIIYYIVA